MNCRKYKMSIVDEKGDSSEARKSKIWQLAVLLVQYFSCFLSLFFFFCLVFFFTPFPFLSFFLFLFLSSFFFFFLLSLFLFLISFLPFFVLKRRLLEEQEMESNGELVECLLAMFSRLRQQVVSSASLDNRIKEPATLSTVQFIYLPHYKS